jgi:predicted nucleic acid-binding protein
MFVVDTNIIFPFLVESALSDKVRHLYRVDPVWCTEPFALNELANVLATYEKSRLLSLKEALHCLSKAEAWLAPHFISVVHSSALELAIRHRITAYDARFLLLAQKLGLKLITEDKKLRTAAPGLTQSIDEALASAPK